jgi:RNA polymerase sigma-70 factor (ECF subfamily)
MATVVPFRRSGPPPETISDEALVAACAVGDPASLGLLFDRHHGSVRSFLVRMTSRSGDVDDLVQGTFEAVPKAAKKFRGGSKVRTWLLGIARHVALHHFRSAKRSERKILALVEEPIPEPGVHQQLERKEELRRLEAAVGRLSVELREAFVLVYFEELPGAEAAKALDIREGTLWKRLHDARKRIRREMERVT